MSELLNAALNYAAKGWCVLPVKPGGKAPITANGYKDATTDETTIRAWWNRTENANIGIAMQASGLVAVDVDSYKDNAAWQEAALQFNPEDLSATYVQTTPRGGKHYLYRTLADESFSGTLCPNVDIKHNGYILAAPSTVGGNPYTVISARPPRIRPDHLVKGTGVTTPNTPFMVTAHGLPKDPEGVLKHCPAEEYNQWIEGIMAIKSAYASDLSTGLDVAIAWSSGAYGNTVHRYTGPEAVEAKWGSVDVDGGITWGTMVHQARLVGYNMPEQITLPEPTEEGTNRWARALRLGKDRQFSLDREYLVKGYIMSESLTVMYGPPNCGKSFLALSLANSVQNGSRWLGKKVKKGQTVYIAAEGGGGIVDRLEALHREGLDVDNMMYIPEGPNLADDASDIAKALTDLCPKLIIIDTLARTMGGMDENSNTDMNRFVKGCDKLRESTGAAVVVIHHSGKDVARGARGASSLLGAVDTELLISGSEGSRSITVTKQRDIAFEKKVFFELKTVLLGQDLDGEDFTSCVVKMAEKSIILPENLPEDTLSVITRMIGVSENNYITKIDLKDEMRRIPAYRERSEKGLTDFIYRELRKLEMNGFIRLDRDTGLETRIFTKDRDTEVLF